MAPAGRPGGEAVPVERVEVSAYSIPTATQPESDGTAVWSRTVLVLVELTAGGQRGLGYTYADTATARFVHEVLREALEGQDALDIPARHQALLRLVRNHGREGAAAMALSAVDCALWDVKARVLGLPLVRLLGAQRACVPVYGSGGFTSSTREQLQAQLGGWAQAGIPRVKMKVGGGRRRRVHGHCHHKSLFKLNDEQAVLKRMGLEVELPDTGCCGMAGSFGYEAGEKYEVSVKCGERKLLPRVRAARDDTLIVANGFSCREMIHQHTDRKALHLAQVLHMAKASGPEGPKQGHPETGWVTSGLGKAAPRPWLRALAVGAGLLALTAWLRAKFPSPAGRGTG